MVAVTAADCTTSAPDRFSVRNEISPLAPAGSVDTAHRSQNDSKIAPGCPGVHGPPAPAVAYADDVMKPPPVTVAESDPGTNCRNTPPDIDNVSVRFHTAGPGLLNETRQSCASP